MAAEQIYDPATGECCGYLITPTKGHGMWAAVKKWAIALWNATESPSVLREQRDYQMQLALARAQKMKLLEDALEVSNKRCGTLADQLKQKENDYLVVHKDREKMQRELAQTKANFSKVSQSLKGLSRAFREAMIDFEERLYDPHGKVSQDFVDSIANIWGEDRLGNELMNDVTRFVLEVSNKVITVVDVGKSGNGLHANMLAAMISARLVSSIEDARKAK